MGLSFLIDILCYLFLSFHHQSINPRSSLLTSSTTNRELHHQHQQHQTVLQKQSQSPTSSRIQALLSSPLDTGTSSSSSTSSIAATATTVTAQADNFSRRNNQLFNHNDTNVGTLQQQHQQLQSRQQHQQLHKLNSNNERENLSNASER